MALNTSGRSMGGSRLPALFSGYFLAEKPHMARRNSRGLRRQPHGLCRLSICI